MKKIILAFIAFLTINSVKSQTIDIPQNVKTAFEREALNNPPVDEKWTTNELGWYMVKYVAHDVKCYINYNANGVVLEQGVGIVFEDLMEEVRLVFLGKYSIDDVVTVYRIYSGAAPERNRIDIKNGNTTKSLYYSLKGNLYMQK